MKQEIVTVADVQTWLKGLAQDNFPEDAILEGRPDQPVTSVLVCWLANHRVRAAARAQRADLIVAHESHLFTTPAHDPGCPPVAEWAVTRATRAFFRETGSALIRAHRNLDSYCVPREFGAALGLPAPAIHTGHNGYEFTLVYDIAPRSLRDLAVEFKNRLQLPVVRTSAGDPHRKLTRLGLGWGGVSLSANLQYMELLRHQGVQAVIGGEIDEYAMEYYRDSGLEWIELGHYASEIIGLQRVARDLAKAFAGLRVECFHDTPRIAGV